MRVGRSADLGDRTCFFEIIPDLLVIAGFDGYMRDVNTAWQNAVGWGRKELLAVPFLEFIHPEDRTRMAAELESVKKGIFMMFLESRFQCKDGTYKWLMWKAAGMPGRSKMYLLGREIMPGREAPAPARPGRAESAVERRAKQLDLMQEWLGAGSWEVDLPSMRFWWSDGLARILGYSPAECPATSEAASHLIVAEDRERMVGAMRDAFRRGSLEVTYRALRADGTIVPMRGLVKAIRDHNGVPQRLCGVVRPEARPDGRTDARASTSRPPGLSDAAPAL